jgi:hypothetical protein
VFIKTLQTVVETCWHAPVQAVNTLPAAAVAVKMTVEPASIFALQAVVQVMTAGVLMTEPFPIADTLRARVDGPGPECGVAVCAGIPVSIGLAVEVAVAER